MKLACVRCKHKKIKCDRGEPACHQCTTASTICQYVERRKRPRFAPDKGVVRHLSERLESLEKQLIAERSCLPNSPSPNSIVGTVPSTNQTPSISSPRDTLVDENGQDSWIYRMATDARRGFLKARPISPSHTDNAMSTLDKALSDLGKLRVRPVEEQSSTTDLKLSPAESSECIDMFVFILSSMFMVEIFGKNGFPEVNTLYLFPELVSSPYVTFDPGLHVLYYNAVYYGLHILKGPGDLRTLAAYRKVLDSAPAWLASPSESDLNGWTAALTSWTAIVNFDYQLSWRLHCKSCQFIKQRGLDRMDIAPAATNEEEAKRNEQRPLYWHALWCDMFFRLFCGKPSVLKYSPNSVKPLDVIPMGKSRPKASQIMLAAVFVQGTVMTADILHYIDKTPPHENKEEVSDKVEQFCGAMEEMITDWNLENQLMVDNSSPSKRHVMADYLMSLFSIMVGVKRLTRRPDHRISVDQTTLRAARKVVSIVLNHAAPFITDAAHRFVSLQFISFYPFCAVFSLYEHILACTNPEDCEDDLRTLETVGSLMVEASKLRTDFESMSNTINALNKVSRTFQDGRKRSRALHVPDGTSSVCEPLQPEHQQANGYALPTPLSNSFRVPSSPRLQFSASDFPDLPDFTSDGLLNPLDLVRYVENDFMERNWHDDWWNIHSGTDPIL